jgi:hypothetical protein
MQIGTRFLIPIPPPSVLFVTATTAIPYASAIRECWRIAYPDEKPPKVFFIDVSEQRFGIDENYEWILTEEEIEQIDKDNTDRLREIGARFNAFENTAVFDEYKNSGNTILNAQNLLENAGYSDTNYMHGRWGHVNTWSMEDGTKPVIRSGEQGPFGKTVTPYRRLNLNITDESKKLVRDMRKIGRKMGEEILRRQSQNAA